MDNQRLHQVRSALENENLDALVCRLPENIVFLSGYWPLNGWSFLLFPREGIPVCIVPHCEENEAREELWEADCIPFLFAVLAAGNPYDDIKKNLKEIYAGENWTRIGIESDFETVAPPGNAAEPAIPACTTRRLLENVFGEQCLVDATSFLNSQRSRKTAYEIDKLRTVNEIGAMGLKTFHDIVAPGISGAEIVAEVERTVTRLGTGYNGARLVRAFAQVSTGTAETALGFRPILFSTTRKLESGDTALIEIAIVADGFWSDRTRIRVAGQHSEQQARLYEIVRSAQESAIASVRAGITAGEVDEAARAIIRDAGYEKEFFHVTGHGLGFRYHEPVPLICPDSDLVLESGMLHTVEPGIYSPEFGGFRVEDNVVVTESGCEVLGPCNKDLF